MKITKSQLKSIILEEVAIALSKMPEEQTSLFQEKVCNYIHSIRAGQLWFHGAHNVTKGTGFVGDHVDLYGEIYPKLESHYDEAVEKAIGNTGDENYGCPVCNTGKAHQILQSFGSPVNKDATQIAEMGLQLLKEHHALIEDVFSTLEEAGELPLGLNDVLAAQANDIETFIYLLQQRAKTSVG